MKKINTWPVLLLMCLAACGPAQQAVEVERSPEAGDVAVPVELQPELAGAEELVRVTGGGEGVVLQEAPALFQAGTSRSGNTYCAILPGGFSGGAVEEASEIDPAFSLADEDGKLQLREGEQPVLAYNYGMQLAPGVDERYKRSSYVHPIWSLSGTVLTDDFPEDHYHHRGLSWMWPRVKVDGETYDLWHIQGVRQVFQEWLVRETGPVCATMGARNAWQLSDGRSIVDERVWIRAYKATDAGRAIDVRLTLEATDEPVQLLGQSNQNKGYGGLSFRFAPREETVITTPEGVESEDSDHKQVPWADESGRFGGSDGLSGAAIFQHSSHPDFPASWTLRHYGFLGVAWPGNEGMTLQPGEPVTLRYRIWIHEGDAEAGRVAAAYEAFQNAPAMSVSE